jgi:hypothetical protein
MEMTEAAPASRTVPTLQKTKRAPNSRAILLVVALLEQVGIGMDRIRGPFRAAALGGDKWPCRDLVDLIMVANQTHANRLPAAAVSVRG